MRHTFFPALLLPLLPSNVLSADSEKALDPCTIILPITGAFYDLNTITVKPLKDHKKAHKDDRDESWHARGYDYGTNYTLNFCAPVIEDLQGGVVGVDKALWRNVSAYYKSDGKTYSIGCAHLVNVPGVPRIKLTRARATAKNRRSPSSEAAN